MVIVKVVVVVVVVVVRSAVVVVVVVVVVSAAVSSRSLLAQGPSCISMTVSTSRAQALTAFRPSCFLLLYILQKSGANSTSTRTSSY